MIINSECEICNSKIKNAVRCIKCNNFFCKLCIEKWINTNKEKNLEITCPHCRINNFNYMPSPELDNLINSSPILKCEKCLRIYFNNQEFKDHQILCLQVKCKICHEIFKDNDSFIKHFEGRHYEKVLICNLLNRNIFNQITNNKNNLDKRKENNENEALSDILYLKKMSKQKVSFDIIKNENEMNSFKNYFKENKVPINISKIQSDSKRILIKKYDIFYCYQNNNINNKKCEPGNELCPTCMKINQEYHKLKKHYLINSAGRVCTYRKNKVHCLCHFQRFIKKEDKSFCPDLICYNNDICKPCYDIHKLIHFYLDEKLINKLKKRDENYGY